MPRARKTSPHCQEALRFYLRRCRDARRAYSAGVHRYNPLAWIRLVEDRKQALKKLHDCERWLGKDPGLGCSCGRKRR